MTKHLNILHITTQTGINPFLIIGGIILLAVILLLLVLIVTNIVRNKRK